MNAYKEAKQRIDKSYQDYDEIDKIKEKFSKNKVKITKLNTSLTNPNNPSSFEGFIEIKDDYLKITYKDPLPLSAQDRADYYVKRDQFDRLRMVCSSQKLDSK